MKTSSVWSCADLPPSQDCIPLSCCLVEQTLNSFKKEWSVLLLHNQQCQPVLWRILCPLFIYSCRAECFHRYMFEWIILYRRFLFICSSSMIHLWLLTAIYQPSLLSEFIKQEITFTHQWGHESRQQNVCCAGRITSFSVVLNYFWIIKGHSIMGDFRFDFKASGVTEITSVREWTTSCFFLMCWLSKPNVVY